MIGLSIEHGRVLAQIEHAVAERGNRLRVLIEMTAERGFQLPKRTRDDVESLHKDETAVHKLEPAEVCRRRVDAERTRLIGPVETGVVQPEVTR